MTNKQAFKREKLALRKQRVRAKISGDSVRPRLAVSRSANQIYAQLIDDQTGKTLASSSSLTVTGKQNKIEQAAVVGEAIAKLAVAQKIDSVVFDRGGYKYHGRVKALAEAARTNGLNF